MNKRSKSQHYLSLVGNNQNFISKQSLNIPRQIVYFQQSKSKKSPSQFDIFTNNHSSKNIKHGCKSKVFLKSQNESKAQDVRINKENQVPNILKSFYGNSKSNFNCSEVQRKMSIYQEYKQKINKGINSGNNSQQQGNPQLKLLKKQNQSLKNQILNGINRLRLVRKMSQKSLHRIESCKQLNKKNKSQNVEIRVNVKQSMQQKRKISQVYKQKLARII